MGDLNKMNLNYLLNKAYYDCFSHKHFKECNKALIGRKFQNNKDEIPLTNHSFSLKTVYPGLLIGIGNTHAAGQGIEGTESDSEEIKLGFTLDYVTGLPVIPGSTVKGVLHSAFCRYPEYVADILGESECEIEELKNIIFEEGENKVVFFDGVPINPGKDDRILGLENITPHPCELKNPIPLTLLKVIPGVTFLFRFGFDRWDSSDICVKKLKKAFKCILTDLGIGAKTNVGFGVMEAVECKKDKFYFLTSVSDVSEKSGFIRKYPLEVRYEEKHT